MYENIRVTPVPLNFFFRNDPDPVTVELRFRPSPQSNTIHPDKFKRFKLVVALSLDPESLGFFTNHHGTTRIRADVTTHADASRLDKLG